MSTNNIKDRIVSFLKDEGFFITDEVTTSAQQLSEILKAEKESDITEPLKWLDERRRTYAVEVREVGIKELEKWKTEPKTGNIVHDSGKFFSLIGVKIEKAKDREVQTWMQPIMKQEECGILGILRKEIRGVMHYLMWAKFEPGSIVNPQLSPTLQATFSNLLLAHGGKKPKFSEYFENDSKGGRVIVSVVHVEDPGRFYHKTNRCMIVEIPEDEKIEIPDDFIWLTLPQIKKLLKVDLAINAVARSVLGCL